MQQSGMQPGHMTEMHVQPPLLLHDPVPILCPFQALQSLVDYDEDSDEETSTANDETTERDEGGASGGGDITRNAKGGGVNSEGVAVHREEGGERNQVNNGESEGVLVGSKGEDFPGGRGQGGGGGLLGGWGRL